MRFIERTWTPTFQPYSENIAKILICIHQKPKTSNLFKLVTLPSILLQGLCSACMDTTSGCVHFIATYGTHSLANEPYLHITRCLVTSHVRAKGHKCTWRACSWLCMCAASDTQCRCVCGGGLQGRGALHGLRLAGPRDISQDSSLCTSI